jgi:hypothetical protein
MVCVHSAGSKGETKMERREVERVYDAMTMKEVGETVCAIIVMVCGVGAVITALAAFVW